jgi:cation diffusion facilitator CzcD-associated flavoprotein CzcO
MAHTRVKRIAINGLGPAGAIAIDAFAQEQAFDLIRVFERREAPGGCWSVFRIDVVLPRFS